MFISKIIILAITFLAAVCKAIPTHQSNSLLKRQVETSSSNSRCKVCHKCTFDESDPSTKELVKSPEDDNSQWGYGTKESVWITFATHGTRYDYGNPSLNLFSGQAMTDHVQIEYRRDVFDDKYRKIDTETSKLIYIALGNTQCDRDLPDNFDIDEIVSVKAQPYSVMKHPETS